MQLTGEQHRQFTESLLAAYPGNLPLAMMVRFRLDKNLAAIVIGDNLREFVFKLIETAEAEGWTDRLLLAARESNPGNSGLLAFSQQFGLAPLTPPQPQFERIIKTTTRFLDIARWRQKLGEVEAQVCRVEMAVSGDKICGIGFLLGPDVVATNYHVMQRVIEREGAESTNVILRFDYKRLEDGTTLNPGTEYRLAADWLVDHSPMSVVDAKPAPKAGLPNLDELDYALLRVNGTPGFDPVGRSAEPGAPPRKWIDVSGDRDDYPPGTPVIIVQHPQGDPLRLAWDGNVLELNANGTRLTYNTNTDRGSSGSPCFNADWQLIALHHSGDPNFDPTHKPTYNEGVPMNANLDLLHKRGHGQELGAHSS